MTNPEILAIKLLFAECEFEWAIGGGWAIDLFLGKQTRPHKDIDIFIWRDEQLLAQSYLTEREWYLMIAHKGDAIPWSKNNYFKLPFHAVWCKHETFKPEFIELLFNERNATKFLFRRDLSITVPIETVICKTEDEIPYLAPEITLLYKSNNLDNEGNQHDFELGFPAMSEAQQDWLINQLKYLYGDDHIWIVKRT